MTTGDLNPLYEQAMRDLRALLHGAEPYHAWVHQYVQDAEFRAYVQQQLSKRRDEGPKDAQ